ncbi:5'-nucleotidase C-terminal domain-containing protein [Paenibacillus sp. IHBB 10380]|uniref:5'-nucleotidase C-terminal domain-containing protein n=1 Tax=Paenibacillus sp. IHBB 10380 TaxID=1566358 RepID=UPI0005CFC05B|nr:5'-nucleotidase C-terminal domain-containing protein [Paenibacillus sp. IHBB 10380]AJS60070.1 5'-nucleotidase [Paenibacillus sp. IHBB 10380]
MNTKKWLTSLTLTLSLLIGSVGTVAANGTTTTTDTQPTGKHITILHTNDMHARAVEASPALGFAKLAGIIDSYRSKNPNTLLLDAGDAVHGTTFATLVEGESVATVMKEMGYQAMVPGNHEFNYGYQRLVELSKIMGFPVLSANIKKKDGSRLFDPYLIKEVDGVKVGIIALTTPETAYKTNPKNVEGLKFTDPSAEAKVFVDELRDKVDVIVVIGHLGQDESSTDTSFKVVKEVPGIDVFIDGHSHTVLENGLLSDNNTLIASTGEYTEHLGVVDLWVDSGKVTKKTATLIDEKEAVNVKPNAKIATLVDSILAKQEPLLKEEVGTTPVKLEGTREKVRASETNLGDLITDAMRDISSSDVAITNGGGIRTSIDAGTITKGGVITVLPFGNQIVTLNVSGADLKAALENGVSDYPEPKGAFPQVSGLSFQIDPSQPQGSRVHSVMVGSKALVLTATYSLATNDFMSVGGDEYTMFSKYTQAGMYGSLDEALIKFIKKNKTISTESADRITEGKLAIVEPTPETKPTKPVTPTPKPEVKPVPTPKPEVKPAPVKDTKVHVVKAGDTLYSISKKYNTTWQVLRDLNHLKNAHWIYPGQKITLSAA